MMAGRAADDITALAGIVPVSRETADRLERFMALLRKWQPVENLVSAATLPEIWRRHVADSAQLVSLFPKAERWLDLGSGAGFPGLVLAIFMVERPHGHVDLVESNRRKCAFLRQAIRETETPAAVHEGRIEDVLADWRGPVDRLAARALAPLNRLFELAYPLMRAGAPAAFHKGQDFAREIDEAAASWDFDLVRHPSKVDDRGVILEVTRLMPRSSP